MLKRNFGTTRAGASPQQASAVGFGAGHLGYDGVTEREAHALLDRALEPEVDDWQGTALRFSAFTPGVSTAIVGTSRISNLEAAAAAVARGPLPAHERHRREDAFAREWPGEV